MIPYLNVTYILSQLNGFKSVYYGFDTRDINQHSTYRRDVKGAPRNINCK